MFLLTPDGREADSQAGRQGGAGSKMGESTVCTALTLFTLTYGFDSFPPDAHSPSLSLFLPLVWPALSGLSGLSCCA